MTWNIINTLDITGAAEARSALESVGHLTDLAPDRSLVLDNLADCDAYMASAVVRIDGKFLACAPNLRLIGSPHTGRDHLDLASIEERGIKLFTITAERELLDGFTATSELAFGLLLTLVRRIPQALAAASAADWARERFTGFQLSGKTFGVVGLGRLGTISARIASGFGMRVLAHDIAERMAPGVEIVEFDALLQESDVVSVHVHLSNETRGLFDGPVFAKMKAGAILLNTSRGAVVDDAALMDALESGHLGGAGLDVIDGEWLSSKELARHPLIRYARDHDNLIIVPHIGGATLESIYGARVFMARKMAGYLRALEGQE